VSLDLTLPLSLSGDVRRFFIGLKHFDDFGLALEFDIEVSALVEFIDELDEVLHLLIIVDDGVVLLDHLAQSESDPAG